MNTIVFGTLQEEVHCQHRPLISLLEDLEDGGAESRGEEAGNGMKPAATEVQTVVIPGAGPWVAEQAPEELLTALIVFLAPYGEGKA